MQRGLRVFPIVWDEHSPQPAVYPEAPECACSWPCRRSASVLQPVNAVVGEAPPPVVDNARLNTHSSAIERALRPAAASNTMRAGLTSRCAVVAARHRASSTFRTFGLSRTSFALRIAPILKS